MIKLSLSDDGQSLVVTEMNENHSHDISNSMIDVQNNKLFSLMLGNI